MLKLLLDKSSRVHIFQYLSTCICYKKKKKQTWKTILAFLTSMY